MVSPVDGVPLMVSPPNQDDAAPQEERSAFWSTMFSENPPLSAVVVSEFMNGLVESRGKTEGLSAVAEISSISA